MRKQIGLLAGLMLAFTITTSAQSTTEAKTTETTTLKKNTVKKTCCKKGGETAEGKKSCTNKCSKTTTKTRAVAPANAIKEENN